MVLKIPMGLKIFDLLLVHTANLFNNNGRCKWNITVVFVYIDYDTMPSSITETFLVQSYNRIQSLHQHHRNTSSKSVLLNKWCYFYSFFWYHVIINTVAIIFLTTMPNQSQIVFPRAQYWNQSCLISSSTNW